MTSPSPSPESAAQFGDLQTPARAARQAGLQERFGQEPLSTAAAAAREIADFTTPPARPERSGDRQLRLAALLGDLAATEVALGLPPEAGYLPPGQKRAS